MLFFFILLKFRPKKNVHFFTFSLSLPPLCVYLATFHRLRINLEYLEMCVCVLTFCVFFFIIRVCSHQPVLMFYFIAVHTMLDCTCQTLEYSQCLLCASAHTTYIPVCN